MNDPAASDLGLNPTGALNTTSLKCCVPSTNAVDRRVEKNTNAFEALRSPQANVFHLNSPGFRKNKRSDTFLTDLVFNEYFNDFHRVMFMNEGIFNYLRLFVKNIEKYRVTKPTKRINIFLNPY